MKPCQKCLENSWDFEKIDDIIRATCKFCGYDVEFDARNARKKETQTDKKPCRKCGGRVVKKETKKKARIYSHYFYCLSCRTMYYNPDFKKDGSAKIV